MKSISFFAALLTLLFTVTVSAQVSGVAHIENAGDTPFSGSALVGTKGQNLRLEGFSLTINPAISGLSLTYMCHVQDFGDTEWLKEGDFCGTRGQGRRIEGIAIKLSGSEAGNYDVIYQSYVESKGDVSECKNGQFCGTRGEGRRLEAFKVTIVKRTASTSALMISYEKLFLAVKSQNTDEIKQNMSRETIKFAEKLAVAGKKPVAEVYRNGLTRTTSSKELPQMKNERTKDGFGALEVKNTTGGWDYLPFVFEDGSWKLALGEVFVKTYKKPQ